MTRNSALSSAAFAAACAFLFLPLFSCSKGGRAVPKIIVARSGEYADDGSAHASGESIRPANPLPRIVMDPADKVISVMEANLDQDSDIEQVIAVKRIEPVSSPVRIIVADSNSAKGRYYYQSCQADTGSVSSRIFGMSLQDLVGDHGTEIVVRGMDSQGKLTLDVFKRAAPAAGKDLVFRSVCHVSADNISIDQVERSAQYSSGQKNGQSFPITASDHDPASGNSMDLLRTVYTWSFAESRFVPGTVEKVPGEKVEQKQLDALFASTDTESFASFLDGLWIELGAPAKPGAPPPVSQLISFQPGRKLISRHIGDTMEIYVWSGSSRLLYDRLLVTIADETSHTVARYIIIRALSMDSIEVSIQEADLADDTKATMVRVTDSIADRYLNERTPSVQLAPSSLSGAYRDEMGLRLSFSGSVVTWVDAFSQKRGYYISYAINGVPAIAVRFLNESGSPGPALNYLVEPGSRKEMGKAIRTLTLSPIRLTVGGYEEDAGDPLVLDKMEDPPG